MQVLANELAQYSIRVNTIHSTGVATGMVMNDAMAAMVEAGDPALSSMQNALPIQVLMPEDRHSVGARRWFRRPLRRREVNGYCVGYMT
jgi:NAD(P)-dependent dehydrogenase (short-subunit alcohol dehydrogenase family)